MTSLQNVRQNEIKRAARLARQSINSIEAAIDTLSDDPDADSELDSIQRETLRGMYRLMSDFFNTCPYTGKE